MFELKRSCDFCKAQAMCNMKKALGYYIRDLKSLWVQGESIPFRWPNREPITYANLNAQLSVALASGCEMFQPVNH